MATVTKKSLKEALDRTVKGAEPFSTVKKDAFQTLVDTAMSSTYSNVVNTTSGSGVVNIPIVQPANTVIEDIIPICTSAASFDAASLGFLVSSGSHGAEDVVLPVVNAIAVGSSESTSPGQGSSIHGKVATSMGGGAPLVITPAAGYTATERTLYCQVSGSTGGFATNTGAFRVIAKYYNL
jgi:hypothetical protein